MQKGRIRSRSSAITPCYHSHRQENRQRFGYGFRDKIRSSVNWQPTLKGPTLRIRPLAEDDFDALFAAASDPLIWEVHPDRERYTLERFRIYFQSAIESKGAIAVCDLKTSKVIGSSRFTEYDKDESFVLVGFTFLTREYWGGKSNLELKTLMLNYAFQFVDKVYFIVGQSNFRSQRAMEKIGGVRTKDLKTPKETDILFKIKKSDWISQF